MNLFMHGGLAIDYRRSPEISSEKLNELYAAVWEDHKFEDMTPQLRHSLAYVCAFHLKKLVGFVYLPWDAGEHAFIMGTAVHPDYRRKGIGVRLVKEAVEAARQHNIKWIHVDFEPHLQTFYYRCGFRYTNAGLIKM